ncbi:serine/threonine-protein kinase [Planobispora siamensis]|uniref:non-specific serine/threonine protein kinase n=1 Tax=Planobispora siamensis TaxID=936338 RepID=A0A8J3S9H0_9ACTN|nr:serine/threonine-protein kinase [Planobispora siamensis]GIH89873.1 hypothetical protein Psi01_05030 [Planobispora siamensis]
MPTTGSALPVLAGRYRAVERLGAGGMGIVWRARDELLHREVAIKEVVLAPHLPEAQRAEMRERTLREARAAARLNHPSIVAVHDVIAQDGRPWIVMDLVRGRSLEQVVRAGGPLAPDRAAAVGLAVLDGLTLAHNRGIMHRDVKPANIMVSDDGGVLLTDFGIATLEGDVQLTSPDALVGSPGYIAPERLRGTGDGPAADLWSLGATLYAAVEGRGPFQRGTPVATLGAVLTQETPPPSRAGGLASVLLAVLAKDPRERPGAAALRAALREVSLGRPAGPLSPVPDPQPSRGRRAGIGARRRAGPVAGAGLAVVAAGAAAVFLTSGDPAAPVPSPVGSGSGSGSQAEGLTAAPDPCSLLSEAQAGAVVPGASPFNVPGRDGGAGSCTWEGAGGREIRVSLNLYRATPGKTAPETAHAFFASERTRIEADRGSGPFGSTGPLRDVARVGDEAFAYDVIATERAHSVVRFRSADLLVEVNLSTGGERATSALRSRTLRTAKVIAGRLDRNG